MCSRSVVSDFVTPGTVACWAPLSMEFSRQEYWSGLLLLTPGDPSNPGMGPWSLVSPALAAGFFTTCSTYYMLCKCDQQTYIVMLFSVLQVTSM